ncbi:hypothetical protein D3C77_622870 [compost metagenome]
MLQHLSASPCNRGTARYTERNVRAEFRSQLAQLVLRDLQLPQPVETAQSSSGITAAASKTCSYRNFLL